MEKLFENEDFILSSTGHDYDFVGIIETKGDKPLTFFFSEELVEYDPDDEENWDNYDWEENIDEDKTEFLGVWEGLKPYDWDSNDPYQDDDEEQEVMMELADRTGKHIEWFRTRDDKSTGFLSDPRDRGQFLALIKAYCPEKLSCISWA